MALLSKVENPFFTDIQRYFQNYLSDMSVRTTRISSGRRIQNAGDGPASAMKATVFKDHMSRLSKAITNVEDSLFWFQTRDAGLGEQEDLLLRAYDLAVTAANDTTLTATERSEMDTEFTSLLGEMDSIGRNLEITGHKSLFDPGMLDVIWVMDVTGSMGTYATALRNAATQMYTDFAAAGYDLQMGITGFDANAGVWGSSKTLHGSDVPFIADVDTLITVINPGIPSAGGTENGLGAIDTALADPGLGGSLRPLATKITVLLTDEDADDFGNTGWGNNDATLSMGAGDDAIRQATANNLIAADSQLYAVGVVVATPTGTVNSPDADYVDVVGKVGAGNSYVMDLANNWVDSVTGSLMANGGPWDSEFQYGPEAGDTETIVFNTVTSGTAGASGSLLTAGAAAAAVTNIENAQKFVAEARAQAGSLTRIYNMHLEKHTERMQIMQSSYNIEMGVDYPTEIEKLAEDITGMDKAGDLYSFATSNKTRSLMGMLDASKEQYIE